MEIGIITREKKAIIRLKGILPGLAQGSGKGGGAGRGCWTDSAGCTSEMWIIEKSTSLQITKGEDPNMNVKVLGSTLISPPPHDAPKLRYEWLLIIIGYYWKLLMNYLLICSLFVLDIVR